MSKRLHTAVLVQSAALIAYQLVLMQVLSIVQWYHFAYMVISVGLLGFGASGTILALSRDWWTERFSYVFPLLMIGSGAAMALVVPASQHSWIRFDAYLLFVEGGQILALVLTYLLLFIPFLLGALAVGLVFVVHTEQSGSYYFVNLLGSGIGGAGAVGLMSLMEPARLPAAVAFLPILGGGIAISIRRFRWLVPAALAGALLAGVTIAEPPTLVSSQYKDLRRALTLPDAEITVRESSPYGLVQIVSSPALRYAPGLSLTYDREVPVQQAVFNNGNRFGTVVGWERGDTTHVLDYSTGALPYVMRPRDSTLVLNAGTGEQVAHALTQGARPITAVEPHGAVVDVLRNELAAATDSFVYHESVELRRMEPRTFLAAGRSRYDVISLPTVGAFGGTAGLGALEEQYTLTTDAFEAMWRRLSNEGVISVSCWMDYPYRYPLKLLATLVETMEVVGIEEPTRHLAAVRSWGMITMVVKRTPLTGEEVSRIRAFSDEMRFDPLLLPGLSDRERSQYNELQNQQFFSYVDRLITSDRQALYEEYPFHIQPATDQQPYFSQFLRLNTMPVIADQFGPETVPFLELGYIILLATLVQIVAAAVVLILLPLVRIGGRDGGTGWTFLYFGSLGLGYLFVEIIFIQRFTLYLGLPIYATAVVIATLMIASGVGSYFSSRLLAGRFTLTAVTALTAGVLALYIVGLNPVVQATIEWPLEARLLGAVLMIVPAGLVMGMPFPLGLRYLSTESAAHVPWAWGIDGCFSVISTALATLLAVEIGLPWVLAGGAAAYLIAALATVSR